MVELVDAPDSKSGSERSVGSIPTARTIFQIFAIIAPIGWATIMLDPGKKPPSVHVPCQMRGVTAWLPPHYRQALPGEAPHTGNWGVKLLPREQSDFAIPARCADEGPSA